MHKYIIAVGLLLTTCATGVQQAAAQTHATTGWAIRLGNITTNHATSADVATALRTGLRVVGSSPHRATVIKEFTVSVKHRNGDFTPGRKIKTGGTIPQDVYNALGLAALKPGDRLFFESIMAQDSDGKVRPVSDVTIVIQ